MVEHVFNDVKHDFMLLGGYKSMQPVQTFSMHNSM